MNLTLSLTPAEEEKLRAKARALGTTIEQMVREAIEPILASVPEAILAAPPPRKSLLGIWSQYGPGPSEEEIDQNRAETELALGMPNAGPHPSQGGGGGSLGAAGISTRASKTAAL